MGLVDDRGEPIVKITISTTRVIDKKMYPDWVHSLRQIGVPTNVIKDLEGAKRAVYITKHRGLQVITTYEVEE